MPFDSQGNFTRLHSWEQDRIDDIDIVTDHHDAEDNNFSDGLSMVILKDGRTAMSGNLDVGGFQVRNMADGVLDNDAVCFKQLETKTDEIKTELTTVINSTLLVGDIKCSGLQNDHGKWMLCNGRAVSREDYKDLYEAIGTTFGKGNNITTFNLPDCRGVAVRGVDNGRGLDNGRTLGSYQADQMQSHTHGLPGANSTCPGGSRTLFVYGASDSATPVNGYRTSGTPSGSVGGETRMKSIALNYFIKVKED